MEDFIPKNICILGLKNDGIVEQTLKDGRKRIINVFNHKVEIKDKNGHVSYSKTLEKSHPLIENSYNYYYWNVIRRYSKKPTIMDIKITEYIRKKANEEKKPCEEYYKIA